MSTTTPNLGLTVPAMGDQISSTIPALGTNFQTLDNQIGTNNNQISVLSGKAKNTSYDIKQDYGAYGDGSSHPLSAQYTTLAAAQVKYPCATALTDETDWCAIQQAVNDAGALTFSGDSGGQIVFLPPGVYRINKTINMKLNVALHGVGDPMLTQIQLINGANCTLLKSPYSAGNAANGGSKFGIKGIMFDGLEAYQTVKANAVDVSEVWIGGYLHDVAIRNVYGIGLVGGADLDIQNLWISYCTDAGWKYTSGQFTAKHVFLENMFTNQTITTGATTAQRTNATAAPGLIITNTNINDKLTILGLHTESCEPAIQMINAVGEVTIVGISATDSALGNGSTRNNTITVDNSSQNYRFYGIRQDSYTNSTILYNGSVVTTQKNISSYDGGYHFGHGPIEQLTTSWFQLGQTGPNHTPNSGTIIWDTNTKSIQFYRGATTGWKYTGLPSRLSAVGASAASLAVTFNADEVQTDANFGVTCTPEWNAGSVWITGKTVNGFTINWATAPAAATNIGWQLIR